MYVPKPPPVGQDGAALAQYIASELQSVAQSQRDAVDFVQLNVLNAAPKRPRDGMVVCADGVHWQPLAAGGGYFGYFSGAWKKLNN